MLVTLGGRVIIGPDFLTGVWGLGFIKVNLFPSKHWGKEGIEYKIIESQNQGTIEQHILRRILKEHEWSNLLQKKNSRGDFLAPCSLVSWKAPAMGALLHPLGGCYSGWLFLLWKMSFPYQDEWAGLFDAPYVFQQLAHFSPGFPFAASVLVEAFLVPFPILQLLVGFGFPNLISVWLNSVFVFFLGPPTSVSTRCVLCVWVLFGAPFSSIQASCHLCLSSCM